MVETTPVLLLGLALAQQLSPVVATSDHFVFRSDLRLNLHDTLNDVTRNDAPLDETTCFETLSADHRTGWSEAVAFYRERLSELHLRGEEMSAVRARILDEAAARDDALVDAVFEHIERARPAYETCLWAEHDERNRAWIAKLVPRVREHEDAITKRLSKLFQHPWPPSPIPVDVVGWVSRSGANTIDEPGHVMMSSLDESYRDDAALEMVFHESSHLLIDLNYGKVAEAIWRANGARMLPRRDLWHTILFYTVGRVTQERLRASGTDGYVPYLYHRGLIDRGWRPYRVPLETHWQSYMDAEVELETAVERLIEAIHAP